MPTQIHVAPIAKPITSSRPRGRGKIFLSTPLRRRGLTSEICQHMLTCMRTAVGADGDGGVVSELAALAEAKRDLSRREDVAVRKARHVGLSWAEIGVLLGVTRQTIHRKYRKTG